MNRVEKILIAVIADPGFLVGCDVGRVQRAERQFEREAAGIGLAVLRGVAGLAVCRPRQISAALDKARLRKRRRDAGGIGAVIVRERHLRAIGEIHRTGTAQDPEACDHRDHHDRDNA